MYHNIFTGFGDSDMDIFVCVGAGGWLEVVVIILPTPVSYLYLNTEEALCPNIIICFLFDGFFLYFNMLNSTLLKLKLPSFGCIFFNR